MIFKKPFAFLIRHFRLINFLLVVLASYVVYKVYSIFEFFYQYVRNGYTASGIYEGYTSEYYSIFLYLGIILIIIGLLSLCLLFYYKKRVEKKYVVCVFYYLIISIYLMFLNKVMISMELNALDAEIVRIYRDITFITIIPQLVFIVIFIIRTLGFNIKHFNFAEDLKALSVEENDDEEIELTFKNKGVKLRRNLHRYIRELIYYFKENKLILFIILGVILIGLIFTIYNLIPEQVNGYYSQNDTFYNGNLQYTIEDSIVSNIDLNGNKLEKNNSFVVIRFKVKNNNDDKVSIDYNNIRLIIGKKEVYPSVDKEIYFVDYAPNYTEKIVKAFEEKIFSLVFKISNKDIKKNYTLKIDNGHKITKKGSLSSYNHVKISPVVINNVVTERTYELNEIIKLNNTYLGKSTIKFNNPTITKNYFYNYEQCITQDECIKYKDSISVNLLKNDKILLVLDYEYNISKDAAFYKKSQDINGFVNSFIRIKYKLEQAEDFEYFPVKNVTPLNLKGQVALETNNKIELAEELYLSVTIRNKEYLINLK